VSTSAKPGGFAVGLAALFGGATLAGAAIGPEPSTQPKEHTEMTSTTPHGGDAAHPVRGLAIAEDGLRVAVETTELRRGRTERLAFRIVDEQGETVRDFDVEHERRMHLIVVRRDLTGFQHLHPRMDADGTWSTSIRLAEAGSYRLYADFARGGEPHTLASDLRVDGTADLQALPEPRAIARTDGYDVRVAEREGALTFEISRDGARVAVEPYLGAGGHLVALRDGDLAFLHVHPTGSGTTFEATFPTPGRYRLFLQFKHAGKIHTAEFTREVG
jgi:hypothetical protein